MNKQYAAADLTISYVDANGLHCVCGDFSMGFAPNADLGHTNGNELPPGQHVERQMQRNFNAPQDRATALSFRSRFSRRYGPCPMRTTLRAAIAGTSAAVPGCGRKSNHAIAAAIV